jgi:hypothetical protein
VKSFSQFDHLIETKRLRQREEIGIGQSSDVKRRNRNRRRASSADLGKPLSSLHFPSGDRCEKAQKSDEPIGRPAHEALNERRRQLVRVDRRHKGGAAPIGQLLIASSTH